MIYKKNIKILIAEDDFLVCEELQRILKKIGYEIVGMAPDGEVAIKMAGSLKPDIILMDIQMPVMDGLAAAQIIQETYSIPTVILTAHESKNLLNWAKDVGVSAYIVKPPNPHEIDRAIAISLARHDDLNKMRNLNQALKNKIVDHKNTMKMISMQRDFVQTINTMTNLDDVIALSLDTAFEATNLDCGGVYIVNNNCMDLVYSKGLSADFVQKVSHYSADSPNYQIIMEGNSLFKQYEEYAFTLSQIEKNEGLLMLAIIPISYQGKVIACMNCSSHIVKELSEPEKDIFSVIANQFGQIMTRLEGEEKIRNLLQEKEIILKEVHHRIKNNMMTLKSLLTLQSKNLDIPEVTTAFQDAIGRINSMGILYEKLYKNKNYEEVSTKQYFSDLIDEIYLMFSNLQPVQIEKQIEDFTLRAKTILPVGIILNELISNSMKYAFPKNNNNLIQISVTKSKTNIILIYRDNGVGLSEINTKNNKGFGLKLIELLVKQLYGKLLIENDNGAKFTIEFEK